MKKEKTDKIEDCFDETAYEDSVKKIISDVEQGLSFDAACSVLNPAVCGTEIKESIIDDALKVLIAEMHFSNGVPLKQLAMKLKLSSSKLINAKESMLKEAGEAAIAEYKASIADH
ncbi:MAG: hypothetical protein HZC12_01975 [Nitrospirae bacterium]|nr:hypothetical protein [Nitrospirota bacterium]